ncbi:hypothetical protein TNCV_1280311 [Trichonephila clavipes]|nr:hypothetical protein TNCV_1280311 [Trichonephila clavipes]
MPNGTFFGFGIQIFLQILELEWRFFWKTISVHVVTGHVLWFERAKALTRKCPENDDQGTLWSAAPQYAVQCQLEVNNFGRLQAVDNDSKLRHKRNVIRKMHSLVLDSVRQAGMPPCL